MNELIAARVGRKNLLYGLLVSKSNAFFRRRSQGLGAVE